MHTAKMGPILLRVKQTRSTVMCYRLFRPLINYRMNQGAYLWNILSSLYLRTLCLDCCNGQRGGEDMFQKVRWHNHRILKKIAGGFVIKNVWYLSVFSITQQTSSIIQELYPDMTLPRKLKISF